MWPFGDGEKTVVLCCIDGSEVSGNVSVGVAGAKDHELISEL